MAEDSAMDMPAHVETYGRVMGLMKWGAVFVFFFALFIVWLIA